MWELQGVLESKRVSRYKNNRKFALIHATTDLDTTADESTMTSSNMAEILQLKLIHPNQISESPRKFWVTEKGLRH